MRADIAEPRPTLEHRERIGGEVTWVRGQRVEVRVSLPGQPIEQSRRDDDLDEHDASSAGVIRDRR